MLQQTYEIQKSAYHWGVNRITMAQTEAERPPQGFAELLEAITEFLVLSESLFGLWHEKRIAEISLTREIEDFLGRLQQRGVRINRIEEIREYLRQFPDMIEVTEKIVREASIHLPAEARFALEVYQDPEIKDEHLVLYVRFKNYPPNVMEEIRSVREKCRAYLVGRRGWLHLTTDFYPAE